MAQQAAYNVNYVVDGGLPNGLGTTSTSTTGWTSIAPGSVSQNSWVGPVTIPFPFEFYGGSVNQFWASYNGILTFKSGSTAPSPLPVAENMNLPTDSLPDSSVAVFWDAFTDNPPTGSNDEIYTQVFGSAPNRQLWIFYRSFDYGANPSTSFAYFGAILEESTNNIYIYDHDYSSNNVDATVGLQLDQNTAIQTGDSTLGFDPSISTFGYYEFMPLLPNNVGLVSIDSPQTGCGLTASEMVEVQLVNQSPSSLSGIPVSYQLNGGTVMSSTFSSSIPSTDTATFTLPSTIDLSVAGPYTLKVWTDLTGDPSADNDTLTLVIHSQPTISSYPYLQDWESGTGSWYVLPILGDSLWELGSPAQTTIDTAYSGNTAWMTDLDNNYTDDANTALVSPCFDLTSLVSPTVSTWLWINSEEDYDGTVLEASTDGGVTWTRVGENDPGFYTNTSTNLAIDPPAWSGSNGQWMQYSTKLPLLAGQPSVIFRFRFESDGGVDDEGIAVDNFGIQETPYDVALGGFEFINPCGMTATELGEVQVVNLGASPVPAGDSLFFSYVLDAGTTYMDTLVLPTALQPADTLSYTLNTGFDLSTVGFYNVVAAVTYSADLYTGNDTTLETVTRTGGVSSYPFLETFDTYSTGEPETFGPWVNVVYDDEDWSIETGQTGSSNTGPGGDHSSGTGNYIYTEASGNSFSEFVVELPCVDLSLLNDPHMGYWYHMTGDDMGSLYVDVFNGTSWMTIDSLIGEQQTSVASPWEEATIDLSAYAGNVITVRFRGITGGGYESDISIDDVAIYEVYTNDVGVTAFTGPSAACGDSNTVVSVVLTNFGSNTQTAIPVVVDVDGAGSNSLFAMYTGTLAPSATDTFVVSTSLNTTSGGQYDLTAYTALTGDGFGGNDTALYSVVMSEIPAAPVVSNDTICGPGTAVLTANVPSGYAAKWYNSPSATTPVATGSTFTPVVTSTDSFWVRAGSTYDGSPLVISEINLGSPDAVEVQNITNGSFDATGWQVIVSDDYSTITDYNTTTWTLGTFLAQEAQYRTDGAVNDWGDNLLFNPGSNGWAMLVDNQGEVRDFVGWGWTASTIQTLSITVNGVTYAVDSTDWTGAGTTACSSDYIELTVADNLANSAADYSCMSSSSLGVMNSSLSPVATCVSELVPVVVVVQPTVAGVDIVQGTPFQGGTGMGTMAAPDTVCVGDLVTYELTPPTGFTNADLGTSWMVTDLTVQTGQGIPPADTMTMFASGTGNLALQLQGQPFDVGRIYEVSATVALLSTGCDTVVTNYVYVAPAPEVSFSTANACEGEMVQFNNTSITTGMSGVTYEWDFGDGQTATAQNPAHTYASPGTYTVTLTVTGANARCADMDAQMVTIYNAPEADFSAAAGCVSDPVVFSDSSTVASGTIASYEWDFGDGTLGRQQNPTHLYTTAGTYTVMLMVTSDNGCVDTITQSVVVAPEPEVDFAVVNACASDSVTFTNMSVGANLNYTWYFGDGQMSTLENPIHQYRASGVYTVSLVASSASGCSDSIVRVVEIYPAPEASFAVSEQCEGMMASFNSTSTGNGASIVSYEWMLGDGTMMTGANVQHMYAAAGTYDVTLIVETTRGCRDTMMQSVEVFPKPEADFVAMDVCEGNSVVFDNMTNTFGASADYQWMFGDGLVSFDSVPTHTYATPGTYMVTLMVTTIGGCMDTMMEEVTVNPAPFADFTATTVCEGEPTIFEDLTTVSGGTVTYLWDFGNGQTATDANPAFVFNEDGTFPVTLTVTTDSGCIDDVIRMVEVLPAPSADFTWLHGGNGMVIFEATDPSLDGYEWILPDTTVEDATNWEYRFNSTGAYEVTLVTMNSEGCTDTVTQLVDINTGIGARPGFELAINVFPNPFRTAATIKYVLEQQAHVKMEVTDLNGKQISILAESEQQPGTYQYQFNAKARGLEAGVYMVRIIVDDQPFIRRMLFVK